MIGVPPLLVRRLLLAPLLALIELLLLVVSPLLALIAAIVSPLTGGGGRPLRIVVITVDWVARHLLGMGSCLGLWVRSGFGLRAGSPGMRRAHHEVLRSYVAGVNRTATRLARITVDVRDSAESEAALSRHDRPLVVLSRHAGEGDSLLVLHALLCRYGRWPRVVMHEALRLDPLLDVLGHRLSYRFVDPRGGDTEAEIATMASTLGGADAVLIFPEGGNFSPERRRRSIERLQQRGHQEEADWARDMEHMAAPRPGGALAALESAPDAGVVFIGHVGIPVGIGNLWRQMLTPRTVRLRMWHVAAEDIPAGHEQRIDWLFGWWGTLDDWVDAHEP